MPKTNRSPQPKRRLHRRRPVERRILLAVIAIVHRPRATLLVCALLLAACVGAALLKLRVSSDQNKLFSSRDPNFRAFLEFDEKFPENEALYVIVEAPTGSPPPPLKRWTAAADAIASRVRTVSNYVESVDAKIPLKQLGAQGVLFEPPAQLADDFRQIKDFSQLAQLWGQRDVSIVGNLALPSAISNRLLGRTPLERFLGGMKLSSLDDQRVTFVGMLAEHWNKTLADPAQPISIGDNVPDLKTITAETPLDLGYYYVPDETNKSKNLLLVRVYPKSNYDSLTAITESVAAIRAAVREAMVPFPEFTYGVTGRPALDADEMETTDRDSNFAEIVAMIAVFIGLTVMLRSFWLALAAEICLAVGIGWTFGWATISVGELNLLSIVFLIALIGIGMDYLVQVLTRYRAESQNHTRPRAVWARVFRYVSAPINTACLGAAGAFLVSIFTDFRGAAELGIIAGGGLLLCLLAGYTVLPAMLTIFPAKRLPIFSASKAAPQPRLAFDGMDKVLAYSRIPPPAVPRGAIRLVLPAIWVLALSLLVPFISRARFNPNLLELQAPNLESTKLVRKLQTWFDVVLAKDTATLRQVRDVVKDLPGVASTESILTAEDNYRWLREHQDELPKIQWSDPVQIEARDVLAIASRARALADVMSPVLKGESATPSTNAAAWAPVAANLRHFADQLTTLPAEKSATRLSQWQSVFVLELRSLLAEFSPQPLDLSKVPPELRGHLVSSDGTYALYIYPKKDLWIRGNLKGFVTQVDAAVREKVSGAPKVTGIAPDIYYTTAAIRKSFSRATIYALCLIFLLVLIDLRDLAQTLLAVSVLALGLPMLVGLMGLIGLDWNFANFFGLPILIGAGHEYGVFMIHRYREAAGHRSRVWRSWDVADRALLLCAYVTCSSFAFFWAFGHHRGLMSLGLVMALGTACIYLSSLMVLRPLLKWHLERLSPIAVTADAAAIPTEAVSAGGGPANDLRD